MKFSKEPNNLYNLNSYKHSGLANQRTVTILPGKEQSVLLAPVKTKKQKKPAALLHKSVMKKELPRMAKAVCNQVGDNYYRPDLKKAALARLSVVHKSLKVAKSGAKKRNRQAAQNLLAQRLEQTDCGLSVVNNRLHMLCFYFHFRMGPRHACLVIISCSSCSMIEYCVFRAEEIPS